MNALKILQELDYQTKRSLYRNVPEHGIARTSFSDKDTNSLTRAILKTFELHGIFATRIDSKGTYNAHLKRFIPSNQKKGLPDILSLPGGKSVWIEVKCKHTGDKLRPHQRERIEELRATGATVFLAEDFQSFYEWFLTHIKTENQLSTNN